MAVAPAPASGGGYAYGGYGSYASSRSSGSKIGRVAPAPKGYGRRLKGAWGQTDSTHNKNVGDGFTWTCSACNKNVKILDAECPDCGDKRPISVKSGEHLLFTAVIVLEPGEFLGAKVEPSSTAGVLKIFAIRKDGGLFKWNMNTMQEVVKDGDFIICINDISGDSKGMMDALSEAKLQIVVLREPPPPPVPQCTFCHCRPVNPKVNGSSRAVCCASCARSKGVLHDFFCDWKYVPNTVSGPDQYKYAMNFYSDPAIVGFLMMICLIIVILTIIFAGVAVGLGGVAWSSSAAEPCFALQAGFARDEVGEYGTISFQWDNNRSAPSTFESFGLGTTFQTSLCVGSSQSNCLNGHASSLSIGEAIDWTLNLRSPITSSSMSPLESGSLNSIRVSLHLDNSQSQALIANSDGSEVSLSSSGHISIWDLALSGNCFQSCEPPGFYVSTPTSRSMYLGGAATGRPHLWSRDHAPIWQLPGLSAEVKRSICNCQLNHPIRQDTSVCYSKLYAYYGEWSNLNTFASGALGLGYDEQIFDKEFKCSKHPDYGKDGNLKCGIGENIYWLGEYAGVYEFLVFAIVLSCLILVGGFCYLLGSAVSSLPGWYTFTGLLMRLPQPIFCHLFCFFLTFLWIVAMFIFVTVIFAQHEDLKRFAEEDWSVVSSFAYLAYSPGSYFESGDMNYKDIFFMYTG